MKVLIGIQARSTSTRLPNKIHMDLGGKPVLQWVLDSCKQAMDFLNRSNLGVNVDLALLIPKDDKLKDLYEGKVEIVEGSELDVISRYIKALHQYDSDYICRITSDCPFIPPHIISRCIKSAVIKKSDYISNVLVRTFKEGYDTEVLSRGLMQFLDSISELPEEREHVTLKMFKYQKNQDFDLPFTICHILQQFDESFITTSIDTLEEYHKALNVIKTIKNKRYEAQSTGICIA